MDIQGLPLCLAEQVVLRQRRALVGPLALLADHDERAVEALIPQCLRGLGAGEACPDDDVSRIRGHAELLCCRAGCARSVSAICSPSRRQALSKVVTPLSSRVAVTSS